jgi:hypothetical protein
MKMWKNNRKPLQKIATIDTEINIIYIHICVVWKLVTGEDSCTGSS